MNHEHLHSLSTISKHKSIDIIKSHIRTLTLHVSLWYPEHERRSESAEFRRTKHQLLDIENRGCWICGTHEHLEIHHYYIEWALQNAVNFSLFKQAYPQFSNYVKIEDFVDSIDNAMVLCRKHHRRRNYGIHFMDFPEWIIQKYLLQNYNYQNNK